MQQFGEWQNIKQEADLKRKARFSFESMVKFYHRPYLRKGEILQIMAIFPVSQFVGQNRDDFVILASMVLIRIVFTGFVVFFGESIEKHDSLVIVETVDVGIAVTGALGPFHDEKLVQREIDARCQGFDLFPEFAFGEGRVFVEQRGYDFGIDDEQENGDDDGEDPEVKEEKVAAVFHDPDDAAHEWDQEYLSYYHLLQLVLDEERWCLKNWA